MEKKTVVLIVVSMVLTLGEVLTSGPESVKLYDETYTVTSKTVKVPTPSGDVDIMQFQNIPYATAKRFEYPDVCSKDNICVEPRYEETVSCLQPNITAFFNEHIVSTMGEEDCLVLTVTTPKLNDIDNLPVMVWIHGGGLVLGNSEYVSPKSDFVVDVHAVVVSINYRLGLLGFLSLEDLKDETLKTFGNYGHADQIAALKWVQQNIHHFGGDPKRVTLLGESAGGTSLLALLASPLAKDLFHSTVALSPALQWTMTNAEVSEKSRTTVLSYLGCDGSESKADVVTCLRDIAAEDFITNPYALLLYYDMARDYFNFPMQLRKNYDNGHLTVVDGVIVEKAPIEYKNLSFKPKKPINVFLSNLAQECYFFIKHIDKFPRTLDDFKSFLEDKLIVFETNTKVSHFDNVETTTEEIAAEYGVAEGKDTKYYKKKYSTIVSDIRSTCPSNHLADVLTHSEHINMYRMYSSFSHENFEHGEDIYIGFGHETEVTKVHEKFLKEFREMLKGIVNENIGPDWNTYPRDTLYLTDMGVEYKNTKPKNKHCKLWANYNMSYEYGWHN